MFESLFRFLFKYPPLFFEQGDFVFGVSRPMLLAIAAAGLVGGYALLSYRGVREEPAAATASCFVGLRLAILAVMVFCLLRPALILKAAVPQQNFLGVLRRRFAQPADCRRRRPPRSAFVSDNARRRSPAAQRAVEEVRPPLLPVLLDRRSRSQSTGDLKYEGTHDAARRRARPRARRAGRPAAGRAGDGHATAPTRRTRRSTNRLRASRRDRFRCSPSASARSGSRSDIQITRVETPRTVLKGTVAGRQRRAHADRVCRRRPCRSTSRTKGGSSARRR